MTLSQTHCEANGEFCLLDIVAEGNFVRMYKIYLTYMSLCPSLAKTNQFCEGNYLEERIPVVQIDPALFQEGSLFSCE